MSIKTTKNKLLLASEKLAQIDQDNKTFDANATDGSQFTQDFKLDDESLDEIAQSLSIEKFQKERRLKLIVLSIFFITVFFILFQVFFQKHKTTQYSTVSTDLILKTKNAIANQFSPQYGFSKINNQSLNNLGIDLRLPFATTIQIETVSTPNAFALTIPSSPSNICSELIKNLSTQFQSIKVDDVIVHPNNFDSVCSKRGQNAITFFFFDASLQLSSQENVNSAKPLQHNSKINKKEIEELVPLLPPIEPGGRAQSPYEEIVPQTPGQPGKPVIIPNYQPSITSTPN